MVADTKVSVGSDTAYAKKSRRMVNGGDLKNVECCRCPQEGTPLCKQVTRQQEGLSRPVRWRSLRSPSRSAEFATLAFDDRWQWSILQDIGQQCMAIKNLGIDVRVFVDTRSNVKTIFRRQFTTFLDDNLYRWSIWKVWSEVGQTLKVADDKVRIVSEFATG